MSDLIDRQNAIDVLEILADKMSDAGQTVMAQAVAVLKDLQPEEPERWIPVTEALPKDMDRLLVTIVRSDGSKRVRSGHYYKGYFMMDNGDTWNETDKEILAWMPLPEPWRGER